MHNALHKAIEHFRLGMEGSGNAALVTFIDALTGALQKGDVLDRDGVIGILPAVLEAQASGDYLRVADLLECEVGPRLV
jgi:hypothetical protein